jgi:hypothetical protein
MSILLYYKTTYKRCATSNLKLREIVIVLATVRRLGVSDHYGFNTEEIISVLLAN